MKRLNIQEAFVGEANPNQEGAAAEEADEVVLLAVRGGEITTVVEGGTPDDLVVMDATVLRGALRLENERVLIFEIHRDASGAFFDDEPAALHYRRHEGAGAGLSTVGDAAYLEQPEGDQPAPATGAGRPGVTSDIMSTPVVTTQPDEDVAKVTSVLSFHGITGLPVIDDAGAVVGVVSEADVIGRQGQTVADIMTTPAHTIAADVPIAEVAAEMTRRRIKRMPVVRDGRLAGVVSRGDIVRWLSGTTHN
jgi:CBS domain-containing protein